MWNIIHTLLVMKIVIQSELKSSQNSNLFENSPRAQIRGWISTWLSPLTDDQQAPPACCCNPNSGWILTHKNPVGAPPTALQTAVNTAVSRCAWESIYDMVLSGRSHLSNIFLGNIWITTKGSAFCSKGSWALILKNFYLVTLLLKKVRSTSRQKSSGTMCEPWELSLL